MIDDKSGIKRDAETLLLKVIKLHRLASKACESLQTAGLCVCPIGDSKCPKGPAFQAHCAAMRELREAL